LSRHPKKFEARKQGDLESMDMLSPRPIPTTPPFPDVANYPSSSNFERAFHEVAVLFPLLPPCNEPTTPTTPSDDVALKMADPSPFLAKKRTSELSSLCRERKSETRFRCAIIMRTKSLSQTTLESQDLVVYYSRQAMMTSQERKLRAPLTSHSSVILKQEEGKAL